MRPRHINKQLGYESGNQRLVELADMFRKVFEGYSIFRYDDEKGFISPGLFIPLLEENNVVHMVDLFILRQAFQFQKA